MNDRMNILLVLTDQDRWDSLRWLMCVRRGVPAGGAKGCVMGRANIELAIVFEEIYREFSDGEKKAIAEAKDVLFQPDWNRVFNPDVLRVSVDKIVDKV